MGMEGIERRGYGRVIRVALPNAPCPAVGSSIDDVAEIVERHDLLIDSLEIRKALRTKNAAPLVAPRQAGRGRPGHSVDIDSYAAGRCSACRSTPAAQA